MKQENSFIIGHLYKIRAGYYDVVTKDNNNQWYLVGYVKDGSSEVKVDAGEIFLVIDLYKTDSNYAVALLKERTIIVRVNNAMEII